MTVGESALSLRIDAVRYGKTTGLRAVALDIAPGEVVGICGHVGAGKTTLALAAAGLLERVSHGRITGRVDHPLGGRPPAAFVFADPWTQMTELGGTVEEEVAVGPENQALSSQVIRHRVDAALAKAGATALAMRVPSDLSGGELQRVALASALALEAPLVVLDEPTAQLDPAATFQFVRALRALAEQGKAILLVEQNLDVIVAAATRAVVLADGMEIASGPPKDLLGRWPPLDRRLGSSGEAQAGTEESQTGVHGTTTSTDPVLQVDGLRAGYEGFDVLRDLSLTIERGSAVAWVGRNGAGKTTLARAIMGLVPVREGSIRCDGIDFDQLPVENRARHAGLVFQDPRRQLFARRVLDEVMFAPLVQGMRPAMARASADQALEIVGLSDASESHPADLAPQAQRRLAIAAAMAAQPRLLILDEPTAGQDAEGRDHIARAMELQRRRGGVALITHDSRFASRTCHSAFVFGEDTADVSPGLGRSSLPWRNSLRLQ
ncbi:MAG: ABC transporter ATP-binding protein [Gemmatimonadaceae bacterium]